MPPVPPPVVEASLVAPGVPGTGQRNDPYLFTASTKCAIRLTGPAPNAVWDISDAPTDFEVIGQVAIFSLSEPGTFLVYVRGEGWHSKCWFQIKSGTDPPIVEDSIAKRVKSALVGPDAKADAARFSAVCGELSKALEAGSITRLAAMATSLKAGLDAVGWVPGKYPGMSTLAGELFGVDVPDKPLDADTKAQFTKQLKLISKACEEVSK
jgi:hypothetical protein